MAAAIAMSTTTTTTSKRIAVVTGGNKGIGLEICRQLASVDDVIVVLTARDEKRGIDAVESLHASGLSNVVFHQLDVVNSASVASLADYITCKYGKLDILVNNAGIAGMIMDAESFHSLNLGSGEEVQRNVTKKAVQTYETAVQCLETNYFGPRQLTQALIPLMLLSNSARIVNVSSKLGQLKNLTNEWANKTLSEIECLTEEKIDEVANGFLKDTKDDLLEKNGWPETLSAYIVSKSALNAYTRILSNKLPSFRINSVTPGFVKTDMSFNNGKFTVEEGARGPVKLALLPNAAPSGLFFIQTQESTF